MREGVKGVVAAGPAQCFVTNETVQTRLKKDSSGQIQVRQPRPDSNKTVDGGREGDHFDEDTGRARPLLVFLNCSLSPTVCLPLSPRSSLTLSNVGGRETILTRTQVVEKAENRGWFRSCRHFTCRGIVVFGLGAGVSGLRVEGLEFAFWGLCSGF